MPNKTIEDVYNESNIALSLATFFLTETGGASSGNTLEELRDFLLTYNQNNIHKYGIDSGAVNTYAISVTPNLTGYVEGQIFYFRTTNPNTGASTLNVDGNGDIAIVRQDGTPLIPNDILAGAINIVGYNGTNFRLLSSNTISQDEIQKKEVFVVSSDNTTSKWHSFEGHITILSSTLNRNQQISSEEWEVSLDGGITIDDTGLDIAGLITWIDANVISNVFQIRAINADFGANIASGLDIFWEYNTL